MSIELCTSHKLGNLCWEDTDRRVLKKMSPEKYQIEGLKNIWEDVRGKLPPSKYFKNTSREPSKISRKVPNIS